jgi:ComF family protein
MMLSRLRQWGQEALSICLPGTCSACEETIRAGTSPGFCEHCEHALFPQKTRCLQCALPLGPRLVEFGWTHCRHCKAKSGSYFTVTACDYAAPIDSIVQGLKYGGDLSLAHSLSFQIIKQWRENATLENMHGRPDVLVPIPGSQKRLTKRGYNQALLLSKGLSMWLGIPTNTKLLQKVRDTRSQAGLNEEARKKNVRDAFEASRAVTRLHIGLVDDVMTTGATLESARLELLSKGANTVSHWIVARTPE